MMNFFKGHFILFLLLTVGFVYSRWRSTVTRGVDRNTSHVIFLLHSAPTAWCVITTRLQNCVCARHTILMAIHVERLVDRLFSFSVPRLDLSGQEILYLRALQDHSGRDPTLQCVTPCSSLHTSTCSRESWIRITGSAGADQTTSCIVKSGKKGTRIRCIESTCAKRTSEVPCGQRQGN